MTNNEMKPEENKKTTLHQDIMDTAYERWTADTSMTKSQFWGQLTPVERVAVFTGNLNYQVHNGGFIQWHDNGYSECGGDLVEMLVKIGGWSSSIATLVTDAMKRIEQQAEEYEESRRNAYEFDDEGWDDNEFHGAELDNLDNAFWEISENMMAEVEKFLKSNATDEMMVSALNMKPFEPNADAPVIETVEHVEQKPTMSGHIDGNIFSILGHACGALTKAGQSDKKSEMTERVTNSSSYDAALMIMTEYVDIEF